MSLKTIRDSIASKTGYHPDTSDDDKNYLNKEINEFVERIYNSGDVAGTLLEIIVFWDTSDKLISLPHYVGHVRGARYYDSPILLTLRDIRPRWATDAYGIEIEDFREIGISTLAIQPDEWGLLTFSLPEGEVSEKTLTISIVGETDVASRSEEVLTLEEGKNSVTTTHAYREAPQVIRKSDINNFDITITDVNGDELAIIPNHLYTSQYSIWQVRDDNFNDQISANSVEVLYKEKLRPLLSDADEFFLGRFDNVIVWQFLEKYYSRQEGKEKLRDAAKETWLIDMTDINRNNSVGKKAEAQAVPNKFYGLFSQGFHRGYPGIYNS